jgi:hypothetical protein
VYGLNKFTDTSIDHITPHWAYATCCFRSPCTLTSVHLCSELSEIKVSMSILFWFGIGIDDTFKVGIDSIRYRIPAILLKSIVNNPVLDVICLLHIRHNGWTHRPETVTPFHRKPPINCWFPLNNKRMGSTVFELFRWFIFTSVRPYMMVTTLVPSSGQKLHACKSELASTNVVDRWIVIIPLFHPLDANVCTAT